MKPTRARRRYLAAAASLTHLLPHCVWSVLHEACKSQNWVWGAVRVVVYSSLGVTMGLRV